MRCFHPVEAFQLDTGEIVFSERGRVKRPLTLRCGQCIGCRLSRAEQWAVRCLHESQLYEFNSFVTLTYDEAHVPENGQLVYRDFQLFMKRLRKQFSVFDDDGVLLNPIRFYMCGEYGDTTWRPHFHACLFNVFFPDRNYFRTLGSGFKVYTSAVLDDLWSHGFCSIGDVTFESAAYVARYVCKKVTGDNARAHYERVNLETGEIYSLEPEFTRMSLKPGIGSGWYARFGKEVRVHDSCRVGNREVRPPRFYDNLLKESDDDAWSDIQYQRYLLSGQLSNDSSAERLAVCETVAKARLSFKVRNLE